MKQFSSLYANPLLANHFLTDDKSNSFHRKIQLHNLNDLEKYKEIKHHHNIILTIGSAASGKSLSTIQYIIYLCVQSGEKHNVLCLRKEATTLKHSCWKDVIDFIYSHHLMPFVRSINQTDRRITFVNNNIINMMGLDKKEKLLSSNFSIIWLEEADQFSFEDFNLVLTRQRGKDFRRKETILTTNPPNTQHFIYKHLYQNEGDKNPLILHANYQINAHNLTDADLIRLVELKKSSLEFYQKYALGEFVDFNERNVFSKINYISDDEYNEVNNYLLVYGIDYGFNNPSTLVECKIVLNRNEFKVYAKELIYKTRLGLGVFEKMCMEEIYNRGGQGAFVYADSAEAGSNNYLKLQGLKLGTTDKSVDNGIKLLQCAKIFCCNSSSNLKLELANYQFAAKKSKLSGNLEISNIPVKENDHAIDALRYAVASHPNVKNWFVQLVNFGYKNME